MILRAFVTLALVAAPAFATGCASSTMRSQAADLEQERIRVIALAPSGGVLADAIGLELAGRGLMVVDTNQTTNLLARLNLDEFELIKPQSLGLLKEKGIDAVMSVRTVADAAGGLRSAVVRLTSTSNGRVLAGATWDNGWGGQAGSIMDRSMRKGVADAAGEIAAGLLGSRE